MSVNPEYGIVLAWGLVVVASCHGYGSALARSLGADLAQRAGWGLVCVWGLCVLLGLSGGLLAARCFGPAAAAALVVIGLGLLAVEAARRRAQGLARSERAGEARGWPAAPVTAVLYAIPVLIVAVFYLGAVAWPFEMDPNDDLVSYFAFPKLMLQTGTFEDPFAFRRITTYGGQSLMKAVTVLFGSELNHHLPDSGIARVLLLGLLWSCLAPLRARSAIVFALAICGFLLLPVPRINTSSELIHAVLLLAVPLTFRVSGCADVAGGAERRIGMRAVVLCGLVVFGASVFRPHIGFAAALFFALGLLFERGLGRASLAARAADLAAVAAVVVLLLAPWSAVLYRSSGTLVFPPFRGNLSAAFASMHAVQGPLGESVAATAGLFAHLSVAAILLPTVVLGFAGSRLAAAVASATLAVTLVAAGASSALHWGYFYRYLWPIPFAATVWIGSEVLPDCVRVWQERRRDRATRMRVAVVGLVFAVVAVLFLPQGGRHLFRIATSLGRQVQARQLPVRAALQSIYERAQRAMPEGEAALAMADAPFLFDHARNRIFTIDAPGAVSPDGAFPYFAGPEAVAAYLRARGIRFIVFTPPASALLQYRRDYWENNPRPERFYERVWAPPMLDLMDNVQRLRSQHAAVFDDPQLVVLDLEAASREARAGSD